MFTFRCPNLFTFMRPLTKVTAAMTTAIRTAGLTLRDGLLVVEKTGEILVDVEDCARA